MSNKIQIWELKQRQSLPLEAKITMAKTHPQLYNYCINEIGVGKVLDYIKVPYKSKEEL